VPKYGLILEGQYDTPVFETLIKRLNDPGAVFFNIEASGHPNLRKNLPVFLKRLETAFEGQPPDRAFVVRDSDMKSPKQIEDELLARIGNHTFSFGYDICVPVREMETWLLSDNEAMTIVARQRGGRAIGYLPGDLEEIHAPKELLMTRLAHARLEYTPAVCAEIARCINLNTIRARCRSFRQFSELF